MSTPRAALAVACLGVVTLPTFAAVVSYGSPFNTGPNGTDRILNTFDTSRNGGTPAVGTPSILEATSYGNANPTASAPTVNGVAFTEVGGSVDFWGNTGIDGGLDELLSGHVAAAGTFNLTLSGLTAGNLYQIQLIVAHDSRGGINQRQYEVSFGGTDYTTGGTPAILTRHAYGNDADDVGPTYDGFESFGLLVGTFTADAATQAIQLRSNTQDGNTGDDADPGLSGYVLIESVVPEPGSAALVLAGSLLLGSRRRR